MEEVSDEFGERYSRNSSSAGASSDDETAIINGPTTKKLTITHEGRILEFFQSIKKGDLTQLRGIVEAATRDNCVKDIAQAQAPKDHQEQAKHRRSVTRPFKHGGNAFHIAASLSEPAILRYLLENLSISTQLKNELINAKDLRGKVPLHYAAEDGLYENVKLLHQHNACLNLGAPSVSDNPLAIQHPVRIMHSAAASGDVPTLTYLVKNGAEIDQEAYDASTYDDTTTDISITPLFYAFVGGHIECVQLLLDNGADTKKMAPKMVYALDQKFDEFTKSKDLDDQLRDNRGIKKFINQLKAQYDPNANDKSGVLAFTRVMGSLQEFLNVATILKDTAEKRKNYRTDDDKSTVTIIDALSTFDENTKRYFKSGSMRDTIITIIILLGAITLGAALGACLALTIHSVALGASLSTPATLTEASSMLLSFWPSIGAATGAIVGGAVAATGCGLGFYKPQRNINSAAKALKQDYLDRKNMVPN